MEIPQDSQGDNPRDNDAFLLRFVQDRDVACPACKYNLRALTTPRCPECGEMLRLQVGVAEPKLGLWLMTTVPLLLYAGPGVFCIIECLIHQPPRGREAGLVFAIIASVPFAPFALFMRRRFARLSVETRRLLAALSMLYLVVTTLWVLSVIN